MKRPRWSGGNAPGPDQKPMLRLPEGRRRWVPPSETQPQGPGLIQSEARPRWGGDAEPHPEAPEPPGEGFPLPLEPETLAVPVPLAAPYRGLDTESPRSRMDPATANFMENCLPRRGKVELRYGTAEHVTGVSNKTPFKFLLPYHGLETDKLFALIGRQIFDVTAAGAITSTAEFSDLSIVVRDSYLAHTQFSTSAGDFLIVAAVDSDDDPDWKVFDGTDWTNPTLNGWPEKKHMIDVFGSKRRLFFLFEDSLSFYYLATESIAGTLAEFDLGAQFSKGGKLVAGGTITRDGGSGADDYTVFITSKGQVAVYQGTNPGSASEWTLAGIFDLPEPVPGRCVFRMGGDLGLITRMGITPIRSLFGTVEVARGDVVVTAQINREFEAYADHNWFTATNEGEGYVLFVPRTDFNGGARQFCMTVDPTSGASQWSPWTGWEVYHACQFQGRLYWIGRNTIYKADEGATDAGTTIEAETEFAWSNLGNMGTQSQVTLMEILFSAAASITYEASLSKDLKSIPVAHAPGAVSGTGELLNTYGTAKYSEAYFTDGAEGVTRRHGIGGVASYFAPRVKFSCGARPCVLEGVRLAAKPARQR